MSAIRPKNVKEAFESDDSLKISQFLPDFFCCSRDVSKIVLTLFRYDNFTVLTTVLRKLTEAY